MYTEILNDTVMFIDYLRDNRLSVTVSCFSDEYSPCLATLYQYEIHQPTVCSCLKTNPATVGRCAQNKEKLKAHDFDTPYYGCCYAGVEEYVIPVIYDGKRIICINVGGYRGKLNHSGEKYRWAKEKYALDSKFDAMYAGLCGDVPDEKTVMSAVTPLKYMLCRLYEACKSYKMNKSGVYREILDHVCENYHSAVTVDSISDAVGYSPSYVQHIFKKCSGVSLIRYITDLRLKKSVQLLTDTDLSVTRISDESGFSDPNYFSTVFKKRFGCSPMQYRKLNLT